VPSPERLLRASGRGGRRACGTAAPWHWCRPRLRTPRSGESAPAAHRSAASAARPASARASSQEPASQRGARPGRRRPECV